LNELALRDVQKYENERYFSSDSGGNIGSKISLVAVNNNDQRARAYIHGIISKVHFT